MGAVGIHKVQKWRNYSVSTMEKLRLKAKGRFFIVIQFGWYSMIIALFKVVFYAKKVLQY